MKEDAKVIGLISVAHGMSHFYQLLLAPLFPFVKEELGVSYAALGFLVALFYTLSAVLQPLAGFVVDRYGARNVLLGGVAFFIAGTLVQGFATGYGMLALGAVLNGIGNSVFHPADFGILNARVSQPRLGYAFSAHGVAGYIGYAVAPVFSVAIGAAFGWHSALLVGAVLGVGLLAVLMANARHLHIEIHPSARKGGSFSDDARVLMAAPVILCFLYFAVFAAGLTGVQSFSVSAMVEQFGVTATSASSALTAYLAAAAAGILAGGFVAARASRHDLVAAAGLGVNALAILLVAMNALPGAALPVALAVAGFSSGVVAPSRDLIVRASTPPGAAGRVFGFVYAGLDVGSLATPVFYGWMLDHHLPHGVFYTAAGFTALAILAVLLLPGGSVLVRDPAPVKKA